MGPVRQRAEGDVARRVQWFVSRDYQRARDMTRDQHSAHIL